MFKSRFRAVATPLSKGKARVTLLFVTVGLVSATVALVPIGCGGSGNSSSSVGLPNGKATPAQVAQGRYLVVGSGCGDCHSNGGNNPSAANWLTGYHAGDTAGIFQLGPGTVVHAANITPDVGTGLGSFSDQTIFNVLRFGFDPASPAGGPQAYVAPVMPWASFRHKTDAELWAIVAYIKHGAGAVANAVDANTGVPPDNWAAASSEVAVGPATPPAFPAGNEKFAP